MLEDLEMTVKSEVAYLNVLLNLIFQSIVLGNISKVLVLSPSFKVLIK